MNTVAELFSELVFIQTLVKLHHWRVSRIKDAYAIHIALGELYDDLSNPIDNIVETYQGKFGIVQINVRNISIDGLINDKLKGFVEKLEIMKVFGDRDTNTYLYNQIDEIVSLVYKTIYKLENLRN